MIDINTITKFSKNWLLNTINNIATINSSNMYLLSDLEDQFKGKTALIAGAGPSLADNIEYIKENRSKFVIFALNKNASYLYEQGVVPDFICCLDAENMERTLAGLESFLPNINAIIDIRTDSSVFSKKFKNFFINFSETDFFIKKLAKFNKFMKFYETGGTASTFAMVSAIKMGFSRIILAGIDLAFKDNIIYAYGEKMQRASQESIVVDNITKQLIQVQSVTGKMVYTRDDYKSYIQHFETLIKDLNYNEVYNISSFGAMIKGVKNVSFGEINLESLSSINSFENLQPFRFELKDFIQEEFYNINNIISMLSKGVFSLELVSSVIKSNFIYQYIQADVLNVLQKNFDPELAQNFVDNTKSAIKIVVEQLQKNKLI